MAEESPVLSPETSPHSHKRRITLYSSSELNSSILEVGVSETQKTDFPLEQSPKKPKFESLIRSLSDESGMTDEFLQKTQRSCVLDCSTEVYDAGKSNEFEESGLNSNEIKDSGNVSENNSDEVSHSELEHSCVLDCNVEVQESGKRCGIEELGIHSNEVSELGFDSIEVSQSELEKKNEGFELKGEILENKDENSSEVSSDKSSENVEVGCEKKGENFVGVLQKLVKDKDSGSGRSLKIEMIDGTLLLEIEATDMTERKRNRKRGKKGNSRNTGSCSSDEERRKSVYSRKEMEEIRYVNFKGQRDFWNEIYNGFSDTVKKEYDELRNMVNQQIGGSKKNSKNGGLRGSCSTVPTFNNQGILGESCSGNASCDAEFFSSSNFTCEGDNSGKDVDNVVGEWSEDEESDDEYESIHRPAFKVEGEPDFESGPPEDGLEFLRRVRWEAKRIPKVKVAKLNNIKIKDQSVYMPVIPDIAECPPHLVPLRPWEDEFIADFSELRLSLSLLEDNNDAVSADSESVIFAGHEQKSHSSQNLALLQLKSGAPTLSSILAMDPVTRVTMLRRRISLFENASDVSRDDCAWLFALCAVVDTPLDADTCASLRCLLRSCAKLRAGKSEVDDEVIMLNVLATISGRFFRQSGN